MILTRWSRGRQHLGSVFGGEARQESGGRLNLGWSGTGEQHGNDECHAEHDPKTAKNPQNHPTITRQRLVERGVAADALVPTWCDQHQVKKISF